MKLSQELADAVARDGLPRLASADDASQHVLYLAGGKVRSMLASDWPPPLPSDPTPQQIAAAIAARAQAAQQERSDASALRSRVLTLANGTVGRQIDAAFTTAELRALLALLLWKSGALTNAGAIKPLGEWL